MKKVLHPERGWLEHACREGDPGEVSSSTAGSRNNRSCMERCWLDTEIEGW